MTQEEWNKEIFLMSFWRKPAKKTGFTFDEFQKENKIEDKFDNMSEEKQESYEKDYEIQKW